MKWLALLPLALLVSLIGGSLVSLLWQIDLPVLTRLLHDGEIRFALALSVSSALLSLALGRSDCVACCLGDGAAGAARAVAD